MLNEQKLILNKFNIRTNARNDEIHFGFGTPHRIILEDSCELRRGKYAVDRIGSFTYLGGGDTIIRNTSFIGRFNCIGSNLVTGLIEHPTNHLSPHPLFQGSWDNIWPNLSNFYKKNHLNIEKSNIDYQNKQKEKIKIGNNIWIGEGVYISQGVTIGDGAIIGSRSVVTKDVEPYSIVGGCPAKIIKYRFDNCTIDKLIDLNWWDYDIEVLDNVDFTDINRAIDQILFNIEIKKINKYKPKLIEINTDGSIAEIYN